MDGSFAKEEVVSKGFLWRDEPIAVNIAEGADVISVDELGEYDSSLLKKFIRDKT